MKKYIAAIFLLVLPIIISSSCKQEFENKHYETYHNFCPLKVGKYITYQLDSTTTKNFGIGFEVKTYIVKDSVEDQFKDNSNQISYKIVRYKLDDQKWISDNAFIITPLENRLEYVENNLRIIKLVNPVVNDKSWMGNNYITNPPFFKNSHYQSWEYIYTNLGNPFSVNNHTFDSTITVVSYDSIENKPFYNKGYNSYAKGYEVYAKNIGKIYQDIINWEYQVFTTYYNCKWIKCVNGICDTTTPDCNMINCDSIRNIPGTTITCDTAINNYYYNGFGVKLRIIDHN